jgi:hypothetical protein
VLETKRLKEILVDDVRSRRNDRVHHVVPQKVDNNLLQAGAHQRPRQAEDHAALLIAQHALINKRSPGKVTGGVGHVLHRIYQRDHIVLLDVDMLDRVLEKFFLGRHRLLD